MKNMKKYGISQADIANLFGYSCVGSLKNTKTKERILKGVDELILLIEDKVISRIKE